MAVDIAQLKRLVTKIPTKSGVYFFVKNNKEIYIGKAINLKNRLKNYVINNDARIQKMVGQATTLKFRITDSEIEALITEALLIKKHRPIYNVLLRDDKRFNFVEFSRDKFPRIYTTHQPKYQDSIGPFTDGTSIKLVLRYLRHIFPYCTCKNKHYNYCLNYHIGNCPGFCCLRNPAMASSDARQYLDSIRAIKDILSGKEGSVAKKMEKEMKSLATRHEFDKAIQIREKLGRLNKIFTNAKVIVDLSLEKVIVSDTRDGLTQLKKIFKLRKTPAKIEGYDISNIQGTSATGAMVVFKNGRSDKSEYRKFKIKKLQRSSLPAQAGLTVQTGDTGMLSGIIMRRFSHRDWQTPDLILVDGGKGQLSSAGAVAPAGVPILALTKNAKHRGDHIYSTTLNSPVKLSDLPPEARNLLLSIDSEAHRFAINYHRHLSGRHILGR